MDGVYFCRSVVCVFGIGINKLKLFLGMKIDWDCEKEISTVPDEEKSLI